MDFQIPNGDTPIFTAIERLKIRRKQLGQVLGCSQATLSHIFNGKRPTIQPTWIIILTEVVAANVLQHLEAGNIGKNEYEMASILKTFKLIDDQREINQGFPQEEISQAVVFINDLKRKEAEKCNSQA